MRKTNRNLQAAAVLAAVMLTAGIPLAAGSGVFSAAPVTASAAEEEYTFVTSGSYEYKKYSDHAAIFSISNVGSTLEIPASIDGIPVTEVNIYAFECLDITSVKFPDTLTEIGPYAFSMCKNLESVTFPDSLKKIGFRAFEDCPKLSTINFPDHLVETGDFTFENTSWLDAQRKKDPLVIINGAVIDGRTCEGKVVIPNGVKHVASGAFSKNENITSVVFPASVTNAQENTFWMCKNLTSAELPGITGLGFGVFGYCSKLTDLKLSGQVTSIDHYTFTDNDATATITFYGSRDQWNRVEKPENDAFLKRANVIFDESYKPPVEEVAGDINADGACSVADAVMLQKHLLTIEFLNEEQAKIADMNKDQLLDAVDLSLLKRAILAG